MDKYNGYVRPNKRMVLVVEGLNLTTALEFLEDHLDGVILDKDKKELTKEDLNNVKSIRSLPRNRGDSKPARRATVSKDPDRKISVTDKDRTKPRTKRDNQWD